tara:strand:+ start:721 stop:1599 length:879 start_codon:yes stop_codon:yes gene_type:complete
MLDNFLKGAKELGKSVNNLLGSAGGPSLKLFGTNLPFSPLLSYRDHFLNMLETWSASIPNKFLWLVWIDEFPQLLTTDVIRSYEKNGKTGEAWNIKRNVKTLTALHYQTIQGCIFAQGVNIPGEQYSTAYAEIPNTRGLVPVVYGDTRAAPQELTIEFRETNTSFTDFLIRPWLILSSHLGMVARPGDQPERGQKDPKNIKTRIRVVQLGKTVAGRSSIQRKIFTFHDCVPTKLNNSSLTYDGDEVQVYDTTWAYRNYTVEGLPWLPIDKIVKDLSTGNIFNIVNSLQQLDL